MRENLRYRLYWCVCRLAACCSMRMLHALSSVIYLCLYHIGRDRIKIVRANLRSSFPDKSGQELLEIEKGFYRHLCDTIVESIKLLNISDEQLSSRIKVLNAEIVEEIAAAGRPIMLFTAHLGNWEWVPVIQYHYSNPKVSAEIYKPQRDAAFNRLMKTVRSRFDSLMIPQHSAYRDILQLRNDNGTFIVGFVADHRSNSAATHHRVQFLNHTTPTETGAERIGVKVNAEFLYLDITKTGRGRYEFAFKRIIPAEGEDSFPYTTAYYKLLEQNILRQPHLWLWSHRRWLYE